MAQFLCRFVTDRQSIAEETVQAENRNELISGLRAKGYRVIRVEEIKPGLADIEIGPKHLKKKSLTLFCRQMATMLTSGIPMIKCFDIVGSQSEDKILKQRMVELSNELQAGCSLSQAMSKHPDDFPTMLVEMVKIGEVTGDMSGILSRMADQYERDAKITAKIKGALTYPLVLVGVALIACVFMLIVVVPQFVDVFNSLNADLPALTAGLLNVSSFMTERWYVLLLVVPIVLILLIRFFRLPKVRFFLDKQKLTLKLIRGPMQKIMSARFARTLYTLIASGVPIVQALEFAKKNVLNLYVEQQLDRIILGIRQGAGLAPQMAKSTVFPKLLVSMMSVGESSGNLEDMLCKTADYFDEETSAAVDALMTVLEPLMILLVGVLIGIIVMALYAPMFGAITAMQGSM